MNIWNSTSLKFNPNGMLFHFTRQSIYNNNFEKYLNLILEITVKKHWIPVKISAALKEVHTFIIMIFVHLVL